MQKTSFVAAAMASAAAIALFAGYEPAAAAQKGSGGHAMSRGSGHTVKRRNWPRGAQLQRCAGGALVLGSHSAGQGYVNGGGGNRQARQFRGGRALGYAPFVGGYVYGGGCGYYYERAVATGSSYWWDRYYDCAGE